MMSGLKYKHIENNWFTSDSLGFAVINVFNIINDSLHQYEESELLTRIFNSGFLLTKYINQRKVEDDYPVNRIDDNSLHGPLFLAKLSDEDFVNGKYEELFLFLNTLLDDSDWGDDKQAFQENLVSITKVLIDKKIDSNQKIYYLNSDTVREEKKDIDSGYNYFILIIIPLIKSNNVLVIDIGSD